MALSELAENGTDIEMIRETIQHIAQHLMDLDVDTVCGTDYRKRASRHDRMPAPSGPSLLNVKAQT